VRKFFLNILNARPEEGSRVFALLGQGFFTGIFLATFDVGAVSVFLQYFEESTLAWAFVASGAVGIVATYVYSYFQVRVPFSRLVIGYLIVIAGVTAFVWFGITTFKDFEPIAFLAFILALPFSYIGLLIFWGTFGRIFSLKQAKRLIGGIDTGQLIASIIALFTIGALIDSMTIELFDLFLISLISLAGLLAVFLYISFHFGLKESGDEKGESLPMTKIFASKYLRLMAIFVIVSIIAATFVDFSFLNVTQTQWENPNDLGAFIARFEAAVVIFSFLFQTFVTDWIIENYGLRLALLINPVLILILVGIAGLTGVFIEEFVWFFLMISITKLFIDALKDALDGPTFKLYFLPIDAKVRFDVTTKIEGVVTAFASMIAGLLLIAMNTLISRLEVELIVIVLVVVFALIPILIIWYFVTRWMHNNYKETLQSALETIKSRGIDEISMGYREDISPDHARENENEVYFSLKLMERLEPEVFEKSIKELDGKIDSKGRLYNYTKSKLGQIEPDTARELASSAAGSKGDTLAISDDELYGLSKSMNVKDRISAAIMMRNLISDSNVFVLVDLLRDMSSMVKREAILTARKVNRSETWTILADMLGSKELGNMAASALYAGGNQALPVLEYKFQKSEDSPEALSRIVKIMTRLQSEQALKHLWDKLEYPSRKIVREILIGLQEANFRASADQIGRVDALLDAEIGKAIWNLAALSEVEEVEHNRLLIDALNHEVQSNFEFIYIYMGIIYDPASINLVKENVETATADGITYAMELLDVFISKELRPKLFPLIEDISLEEKLTKLQVYYPRISYNELQTLNYIINRDYNLMNRWTKACALYSLSFHPDAKLNSGLIAQLYNPDILLAENAMMVIKKIDYEAYRELLPRIPKERRYYLQSLSRSMATTSEVDEMQHYRFNRTLYLNSLDIFDKLNPVHVSQMVDKLQIIKVFANDKIDTDRIQGKSPIVIVESGKIELKGPDQVVVLSENEHFGGFFLDNNKLSQYTITTISDSVVYFLDINDFLAVLTNFRNMAKEVMEKIEEKDLVRS
jgi:hypothetical protein